MKPRLLDLFCGAGGCAMGYHRAGFEVIGVDLNKQKRYPFEFVQADAIEYGYEHGGEFDAIHASPPCQKYSSITKCSPIKKDHPDLVPPTRLMLQCKMIPWVIENVPLAPLRDPIVLCGSMFGLLVKKHRLFESSEDLGHPPFCDHWKFKGDFPSGRSWGTKRAGERSTVVHVYGKGCSRGTHDLWKRAMGIDWMTMGEMAQAIPPAYTEWIGRRLIKIVKSKVQS